MQEIECKVLEVDREAIEKKLIDWGAEKVFEGMLDGYNFDPCPEGIGLIRLRKEADKVFFTLKGVASESSLAKSSTEDEVEVGDFDMFRSFLLRLGFRVRSHKIKRRTSYRIDDVRIEFDDLMGEHSFVPEFMELEVEDESVLKVMLKRLGIEESRTTLMTNGEVIKHYRALLDLS